MSEYAHSTHHREPETKDGLLFDDTTFDAALDRIVDTQGISYHDARRKLGMPYETQAVEHPAAVEQDSTEGVSVSLADRALALSNIMGTFNQLNKTMGARKVSQQANNEFQARYQNPDEIIDRMGSKASTMLHRNKEDLNVLNATDAMVREGFDNEDVLRSRDDIKKDLINIYGPGKAYAPDRQKVVSRAIKAARADK
jgi:hypothetical protein